MSRIGEHSSFLFADRGVQQQTEGDNDTRTHQELGSILADRLVCFSRLCKRFKQGFLVRRRSQNTALPFRDRQGMNPEKLSNLSLGETKLLAKAD